MSVRLNTDEAAVDFYQRRYDHIHESNYFLSGVFLILGILYMALYVMHPNSQSKFALLDLCIAGNHGLSI
jgi:hypothetical protein